MIKPDQNPCSIFAQAQGMGDGEMSAFVEHCFRANYSTISIMDNFPLCQRIKDRVPDCDAMYRDSNFKPAPGGDSKKTIANWFKILPQDKRIRLMVSCEEGFSPERVKMAVDHLEVADDTGWKLGVLNVGPGTVKSGQLKGDGTHEPNEWLTIGEPLLRYLATHPEQALDYHDYTSVFAWIVSNGTKAFQKHDKPPIIDWTLAQWHIGRNLQGINAACDSLGIETPTQIVTECFIDQMNDIQLNVDNPYHTFKSNRWRNLVEPWKILYPGQHAEDILADQFYWIWENIFAKFGRGKVIGMHFFTWLSTALSQGEWKDDDIANAPTFLKRQEAYRPALLEQPPTVPPPPPLPIELGNPVRFRVSGSNWNLRAAPTVKATQIGTLVNGEEIDLYPATATLADGESWKVVKRVLPIASEGREGWSAIPTPPAVANKMTPAQYAMLQRISDNLDTEITLLETRLEALKARANELDVLIAQAA